MSTNLPDSLFQTAFDHAAIGMALVSPEGRWLSVNRSICEIVGYSAEELAGLTFQQLTHPDDLDLDLAYLQQLVAGEITSYRMDKRYIHKSGGIIWVHLSVSAVRDGAGEIRFFISQIEDITSRKSLEVELQKVLRDREDLILDLVESARRNRQLKDHLVTICAWTKRIYHDGRWMPPDEFLASYLKLNVTHGISEEGRALFLAEKKDGAGGADHPELNL